MQDALFHGLPNFYLKLRSLLLRPNTLLCHKHYVTSFRSWTCYRKWGSKTTKSFAPNFMCTARNLRTTRLLWNLPDFQNYTQEPSTSMFANHHFCKACTVTYQNIPYWHKRPDSWHTHKPHTEWLPTSLPLRVGQEHNRSQAAKVRECFKFEYFNTYLWYLPTSPISQHCHNITANHSWISDIPWYHFRHSTSSSIVELVWFWQYLIQWHLSGTFEIVMHPVCKKIIWSKSLLASDKQAHFKNQFCWFSKT